MNSKEKLIKEFDHFSECYDEVVTEHLKYRAHEIIPQLMIEYLPKQNVQVLDLGCGTGISSTLFFEKNFTVTGVDISPGMIKHAQNRPFKKLYCQNLTDLLPFSVNTFDAILLLGVLEFIDDPKILLQNGYDILKKNGVVGITFPLNTPEVETELSVKKYNESQILDITKNAGFKIVR